VLSDNSTAGRATCNSMLSDTGGVDDNCCRGS
jgi:hypothetical protein